MAKATVDSAAQGTWGVVSTQPGSKARPGGGRAFRVLLLHGSADTFTYPSGSTRLRDALAGPDGGQVKLVTYDGLYHELLQETAEHRAGVASDIYAFIEEGLGPAASSPALSDGAGRWVQALGHFMELEKNSV